MYSCIHTVHWNSENKRDVAIVNQYTFASETFIAFANLVWSQKILIHGIVHSLVGVTLDSLFLLPLFELHSLSVIDKCNT